MDIGLKLFTSVLLPALKIGNTFTCFHKSGKTPVMILVFIIPARWRAITGAEIRKRLALIWSKPAAYCAECF